MAPGGGFSMQETQKLCESAAVANDGLQTDCAICRDYRPCEQPHNGYWLKKLRILMDWAHKDGLFRQLN